MSIHRRLLLVAATAAIAAAGLYSLWAARPGSDPSYPGDRAQVVRGEEIYARHCAACHGEQLQGQPNWNQRLTDGRLPAPPHDASGHTWHHPDRQLFDITKHGIEPFAPQGYRSDMPAFAAVLSDAEIWAVLAYIKSRWPTDIRQRQAAVSRQQGP